MLYLCKLPIEIQYLIMKYLSYSPTSKLIQDNQTIILNKQIYYQYIENRFDIFHTNDHNKEERIFQQCIMTYIHITKKYPRISDSILVESRQQFYKEKLKSLLKIMKDTGRDERILFEP